MLNKDFFLDQNNNNIYSKQGYIHIANFLTDDEKKELLKLYSSKEKSLFDRGFHRTLDIKKAKKKKEIFNAISAIVTPKSEVYLKDYKILLTSFMTKEKGADIFDIHQNWSFVDETKHTSLVIWIPLQSVNEDNGCLHFIEGSDSWNKGIRGNNIPWQYQNKKDELLAQMQCLPMEAGDAAIFDDATIHYTSANKTKKPRVSIAQVMIPKEATPIFYNRNLDTNRIEKYEITNDFYLTFTDKFMKGDRSEMKLISDDIII